MDGRGWRSLTRPGQPGREGSGAGRPPTSSGRDGLWGRSLWPCERSKMLALLLFVIHFSRPYPFEKTLSGLGLEGFLRVNCFLCLFLGLGPGR